MSMIPKTTKKSSEPSPEPSEMQSETPLLPGIAAVVYKGTTWAHPYSMNTWLDYPNTVLVHTHDGTRKIWHVSSAEVILEKGESWDPSKPPR